MKRRQAINKINEWFRLVEGNRFPDWTKTPGEYFLWFIETHIEMRPPYYAGQDDEVDTFEWEPE
jgi:hypothetical protein